MSAKKIKLKIVTPERLVLEEEVDQVSLPTPSGEITILPNHISLISALSSGDIVALSQGEHIPMAVAGGFVEVKNGLGGLTEVAILADFTEHVSELHDQKIEEARAKAEELRKKMENKEDVDFKHSK
jgi:F-type H+-transporting ATPase subunit epsilon